MTLNEIRKMPTIINATWGENIFVRKAGMSDGGIHESCLRSHAIVQKLRELIESKTPHAVLLEIIDDLTKPKGD